MSLRDKFGFAARHPLETLRCLALQDSARLEAIRLLDRPHRQPLEDFAAYRNLPLMDAARLAVQGSGLVADSWREHEPNSREDIEEWHQRADAWLPDLVAWNMEPAYLGLLDRLAPERDGVCFVFGGGIGGEAMRLSEQGNRVWLCELTDTPTWQFATWRARKHDLDWRFVSEVPEETAVFDCIVAFNVFGSLPQETLAGTVTRMTEALKPGGRFYCNHDWGERPGHPYIHDHQALWDRTIAEMPLKVTSDSREPGSDSKVYTCVLMKRG